MNDKQRIEVLTEGSTSSAGAITYVQELGASSRRYVVQVRDITHTEESLRMKRLSNIEPSAYCLSHEGGNAA